MSPEQTRILVAEDDPGVRELVRTRLELAGFQTVWASNGADAVRTCLEGRPDAVVLDVNMPQMDGFEVLRRLSAHFGGRMPPVLMLTARHSGEDVGRAIRLGAKDYLTKPFDDQKLVARIRRLLRPRRPAPEAAWI